MSSYSLNSIKNTHFSTDFSLSEKLEEELYPDIGIFDFLKNRIDEHLRKEQKFEANSIIWEKIPKNRFMKIAKIIAEVDDPQISREELIERVAFRAIGKDYMSLEESDKYFEENPDKLLEYMEACTDANYVYSQLLGGLPDIDARHISLIERNEKEKEKTSSWKKILTGGLLTILGLTALGAYLTHFYIPQQKKSQRIAQLKKVGLTEKQAISFDDEYSKYAKEDFFNSAYNQTVLDFARHYKLNPIQAERTLTVFKNFKEANNFLSFVDNNGYKGLNFLNEYPQFAKDYQIALPFYSTNSTLFKIIYDKFLRDPQITIDRNSLFLNALNLYKKLNLADKNLFSSTINALNNVTIANEQLNLPRLDKNTLWFLTNCTQKPEGKYLVDFSPLIFKSVNSSDVYLIPKSARETWLTAKTLKLINQTFDIKNHPEMFLGLNGKIIANAWSIFDNPYGINYYEKNLTASDKKVLDLILLQWNLYSQFAPQLGGEDKLYNRDFPWYNSTKLTKLYPDKNELRIALFKLFYLPVTTFSMKDDKMVAGIDGAKIDLLQAYDEYKKIVSLYPNGKIGKWNEDPRNYYYGWLGDRAGWGLKNTVGQFLGVDPTDIEATTTWLEWLRLVKNNDGIDGYLTKNWKYWDLVKFIVGYERWNPKVEEMEGIHLIIPSVLRMSGYPVDHIHIYPEPFGAGNTEWAVSLPQYIVDRMKKNFADKKILIGPGNTFGLYSCADGLIKERGIDVYQNPIDDGIKEVSSIVGVGVKGCSDLFHAIEAYLMKRD